MTTSEAIFFDFNEDVPSALVPGDRVFVDGESPAVFIRDVDETHSLLMWAGQHLSVSAHRIEMA